MLIRKIKIDLACDERLPVVLLVIFFVLLCAAGGASREDVLAQAVIRTGAVCAMIVQILFGRGPMFGRYKIGLALLGGMAAIAALQLVPLPPDWWAALPGRGFIASAPVDQSAWRPVNIVPDAGRNALFSLLVPLCMLTLLSSLSVQTVRRGMYLLLGAALLSALVALLEASGSTAQNFLINSTPGDFAGIFANRNHQALFLAVGIIAAFGWGFERIRSWRDGRFWLMVTFVLLFLVSIFVSGSRSGAIAGAIAILVGALITGFKRDRRTPGPRFNKAIYFAASAVFIGAVLSVNVYFDRALSLERATSLSFGSEFRVRSLPTVEAVAKRYFPVGSGLGSFNAVFRMAEPDALLEPTYLNHAHNDYLEVIIETGIVGAGLLLLGFVWLGKRTWVAFFRSGSGEGARLARAGALIVVLIAIGSFSDYPARTPMIMAVLALATCWLTDASHSAATPRRSDALPSHR